MLGPDRCTHAHAHAFLGRYTFVEKYKDADATPIWSACTDVCEKSAVRFPARWVAEKGYGWYGTNKWYAGGQDKQAVTRRMEADGVGAPDCKKDEGGCKNPLP